MLTFFKIQHQADVAGNLVLKCFYAPLVETLLVSTFFLLMLLVFGFLKWIGMDYFVCGVRVGFVTKTATWVQKSTAVNWYKYI